jgi:hypothetical protein
MHDGGNIRRHVRFEPNTTGQIMWQDRFGRDKWAKAMFLDISASGARFEMPEPVELRSVVSMSSPAANLHAAQATVRFCKRQGNKYLVGVEFVGGFTWKPRAESAPAVK